MKSARHLAAAALLASLGLAAVAQPQTVPAPQQEGPGMHRMHGERGHGRMDPQRRAERVAKRMADLKQKLAITPAQEGAWTTWTNAMQPSARMQRPDHAELAQLTTPERIDRMRALRAGRMAEMDRRGEATKNFYAALTAQQKQVFDSETARRLQRRGERMGHHHHPRG
jgi:Spy/CpxP family protein refolding chaperone